MTTRPATTRSLLGDQDLYLFNEGTHRRLGEVLGGRLLPGGGAAFSVWAPAARTVAVTGDFCAWDPAGRPLSPRGASGVWDGSVDEAVAGQVYKFVVTTADGRRLEKADPLALRTEVPPRTGSVLWDLSYDWGDEGWMATRGDRGARDAPVSVYEVHLGSWARDPGDPGRLLRYAELAPRLVDYVTGAGFTHVELLPVMEHPFYGSWGYQVTGFFAPTARYGTPQELMGLIDALHQAGVGVLLDWVPSHFPDDAFALAEFDGSHLYEHADPRRGRHPDWGSLIFNYGRHEVRAFLRSSADHWLGAYHADGLRVDAVASMLYLDYSRAAGEWEPNEQGGREDLEAVDFLRQLNVGIYADHPGAETVAEESTAWPGVSRPTDAGGLGFGYKWDMGWMHDTLAYLAREPVHRRFHHGELTFRAVYANTENFVLPLSHDEVVHGKGSLLTKMPGDRWQQLATLRLLYGYQWGLPGKKLLFMGDELAQEREWDHERALDWALLEDPGHAGVARVVADLNALYRVEGSLHRTDHVPEGFEWLLAEEADRSVLAFVRRAQGCPPVMVACNFTPVVRHDVLVGAPAPGRWIELCNTDAEAYGGSGVGNLGQVEAQPVPWHAHPATLTLTLPPLAAVFLGPRR